MAWKLLGQAHANEATIPVTNIKKYKGFFILFYNNTKRNQSNGMTAGEFDV